MGRGGGLVFDAVSVVARSKRRENYIATLTWPGGASSLRADRQGGRVGAARIPPGLHPRHTSVPFQGKGCGFSRATTPLPFSGEGRVAVGPTIESLHGRHPCHPRPP